MTPTHNAVSDDRFIVASEVMHKFMGMVERVARHSGTVLIVGETGTGKERIAQTIHQQSLRSDRPFVDINCAALPEHLVESELFGYEKGAFSGADTAKPGLFEMANKGTIFLDEIGELDPKVQVKLLRILDRAPYYRLGGSRKVLIDVRVVAATNRNLREEVRVGKFRKDLYHRLSQFELCVPPLRERPEDIAALAEHLLAQEGSGLAISPDAMRALRSYSWPGNVRELQNVINKVMFSASGSEIEGADIRQQLLDDAVDTDEVADIADDLRPDSLSSSAIQKALEKTGGHRGQAAVELGISRRTLSRRLRNYRMSKTRSTAPMTLGRLSDEERESYRADLGIPAVLTTPDGQELTCTTTNLSASGIGLTGLAKAPNRGELRIRFQLPESHGEVDTTARLAWNDKQGGVGLTFLDMDARTVQLLRKWLQQRMAEEGWAIQAYPSDGLAEQPSPDYARAHYI